MARELLVFNKNGIYCEPAGVYLDPWRPVEKAIVTHGHSDHARKGHKKYLTHHRNIPIIQHRLGKLNVKGIEWDEPITVNGVKFSLHPAGHIPGSSQVRVEYKGEVWVFSGDYKIENDGVSTPFEPVRCDTFITECTFGLPAFHWEPQEQVFEDINDWWIENKEAGKTSVLLGYSLGKSQRLLKHLDPTIGKIYTQSAIEKMTAVIRPFIDLPETILLTPETRKEEFKGNMVIATPSILNSAWIQTIGPYETAMASGWMAFRKARKRRATDRGFVLSDHCDWQGLLHTIKATGAENVICTHGYEEIFSRYLTEVGFNAKVATTEYESENTEEAT